MYIGQKYKNLFLVQQKFTVKRYGIVKLHLINYILLSREKPSRIFPMKINKQNKYY